MVVSIVAILVMIRDAYERGIRLERCSGCCCHWPRVITTAYWRSSYQVYTSTQEVSYRRWIESKHDDVSMKDSLEGWRPKGGVFKLKVGTRNSTAVSRPAASGIHFFPTSSCIFCFLMFLQLIDIFRLIVGDRATNIKRPSFRQCVGWRATKLLSSSSEPAQELLDQHRE